MAKQYWLLKTEAETFSIDDLARVKREPWSGVRNFQARNHLRAMKIGDLCLIYHTGDEKVVVGIGKVMSKPYPDPTQFDKKSPYFDAKSKKESPMWTLVDVAFVQKFKNAVPLSEMKLDPKLSGMILLHAPRLSVQPVSLKHFKHIITLAK
jgi:predicted RNA-binding protein with PUA-like domain